MRILLVHNFYRFAGGEDTAFETSRALLVEQGLDVETFTSSSLELLSKHSPVWMLGTAISGGSLARTFGSRIEELRPHILHFHNMWPHMSPSFLRVARLARIPTVVTLHNYRHTCISGLLFRDGEFCSECLERRIAWPGVKYGCYGSGRPASAGAALIHFANRASGAWADGADRYVVPSQYAAERALDAGVPGHRLRVIPNTVNPNPTPGMGRAGYAAYAGRLSREKGVRTLIELWRRSPPPMPLKVAGTGPMEGEVRSLVDGIPNAEWVGQLDKTQLMSFLGDARVMIVPSRSPETFGLSAVEALAVGTPVVVARVGALPELVTAGDGSVLFEPGDWQSLRQALSRFEKHDENRRRSARQMFESRYSPDAHSRALLRLYAELADGHPVEPPPAIGIT
jgi:glycosyltransferase involved in cell wall biosynthesis